MKSCFEMPTGVNTFVCGGEGETVLSRLHGYPGTDPGLTAAGRIWPAQPEGPFPSAPWNLPDTFCRGRFLLHEEADDGPASRDRVLAMRVLVILATAVLTVLAAGCQTSPPAAPPVPTGSASVVEVRVTDANGNLPEGEVIVEVDGRSMGATRDGRCLVQMSGDRDVQVTLKRVSDGTMLRVYSSFYLPPGLKHVLLAESHARWWSGSEDPVHVASSEAFGRAH